MSRGPMVKPGDTAPAVTPEEQAKIDEAAKAAEEAEAKRTEAEAAEAAEAAKAADASKPQKPSESKKAKHRFETFDSVKPDGTVVVVKRNIDTGEQTVTEK